MTDRPSGASTEPGDLVASLLRPEAYPWRPPIVDFIETHISWVFLAGDRVVKLKRPVVYEFVDHSTLTRRRQSCVDEVRLNRRLTDGVYLDVVPIRLSADGARLDGPGPVIEWATLMRRLPAEGMVAALLATNPAPADLADRLADRLIPFHRDSASICAGEPADVAAAATRIVTENLAELAPFVGTVLPPVEFDLVARALREFVQDREDALRDRAEAGWIREGHGDLRAEHICLEPNGAVQVFDCVEFSRALRCADVASDLAFLLLDLDRFGAGQVSTSLLARYRAAGIDLPDELLRFYQAHRALVRAKVAGLRVGSAGSAADRAQVAEAVGYLHQATAAALECEPLVIAMTGLSGTGKSTVGAAIGQALGIAPIVSDVVRKALVGVERAAPAAWEAGLYAPEQTRATYRRLRDLAGEALAAGRPVVLDAAYLDRTERHQLAEMANSVGAPLLFVETACPEAVALRRITERARRGTSPSDATAEIHRRQRAMVAGRTPALPTGAQGVVIDTTSDDTIALDPVFIALASLGLMRGVGA